MRKKNHPDQLWLDFTEKRKAFDAAADALEASARALVEARAVPPPSPLRKVVNRLVGVLVDQSGLPFHAAWVLAYHELHARSGYHAVAASGAGTHLDQVEKDGRMGELLETLRDMLRSPAYARQGAV